MERKEQVSIKEGGRKSEDEEGKNVVKCERQKKRKGGKGNRNAEVVVKIGRGEGKKERETGKNGR